jgi:F-type H+-transporting ATPase subunit delta
MMTEEVQVPEPLVEELQLAQVYADAVWNLAVQQGQADEFYREVRSLMRDVFDRQPQLEQLLQAGSLSRERREELIGRVFAGRTSELLFDFLRTLNRHDRLPILRAIEKRLADLSDRHHGLTRVLVRSATKLDDGQLEAVRQMIRERFKIEPDVTAEVDPSLFGGLWIRIGDTVYDRSIRWNLKALRESILTRSAHEVQSG